MTLLKLAHFSRACVGESDFFLFDQNKDMSTVGMSAHVIGSQSLISDRCGCIWSAEDLSFFQPTGLHEDKEILLNAPSFFGIVREFQHHYLILLG